MYPGTSGATRPADRQAGPLIVGGDQIRLGDLFADLPQHLPHPGQIGELVALPFLS